MGITQSFQNMGQSMKETAKTTSISLVGFSLRLVSGFFLGLTLSLIGQQLVGYQTVSLLFILAIVTSVFMKLTSSWTISKTLIFDLVFILIGQILKMYIYLAP
jgi:hypothetical protein